MKKKNNNVAIIKARVVDGGCRIAYLYNIAV